MLAPITPSRRVTVLSFLAAFDSVMPPASFAATSLVGPLSVMVSVLPLTDTFFTVTAAAEAPVPLVPETFRSVAVNLLNLKPLGRVVVNVLNGWVLRRVYPSAGLPVLTPVAVP
jgi:hypothetical protein